MKKNVNISCGDINGISLELILRNHAFISTLCNPTYFIHKKILQNAAKMLHLNMPKDMQIYELDSIESIEILPGVASKQSGEYSFFSFQTALNASIKNNENLLTLPINKYAWNLADIKYAGHTQYLREVFNKNAIMMLGNKQMYVALFTEHLPLAKVASMVNRQNLDSFFMDFYTSFLKGFYDLDSIKLSKSLESKDSIHLESCRDEIKKSLKSKEKSDNSLNSALSPKMVSRLLESKNKDSIESKKAHFKQVAVLGLNPHAGDNGILGSEDFIIKESIDSINSHLGFNLFSQPLAPDCAFIPRNREKYNIFIAMYHDIGLAPLKALYFDNSINISLNLPILRVSPDHGTGYDIAYNTQDGKLLNSQSYIECFKFLISH